MRVRDGFLIVILVAAGSAVAGNADNQAMVERLSSQTLAFTVNAGQWPNEVKYQARARGATVWLTDRGVKYQFFRARDTVRSEVETAASLEPKGRKPPRMETMMISSTLVGARADAPAAGLDLMDYKCNYFKGNDSANWRTDVANYQAVTYQNVYDGIDLKYYGTGRQMEYDFVVKPGADPSQVNVQYEGADNIAVNDQGDLIVTTKWGTIVEAAPLVYQLAPQGKRSLDGAFVMTGDKQVGFKINSKYDASLAVVIDPVLTFSTYIGGGSTDYASGIGVNAAGQTYVCGTTYSSDYPSVNPYDGNLTGFTDIFITKVNTSGSSLAYSTYIGGSADEEAAGMDISYEGSTGIYLTGSSSSSDFPTASAFDASANGGWDAVILNLSSTGNFLSFSTYWGGSGDDYGVDIAVRCAYPCQTINHGIWVAGNTQSTNFPTLNASQTSLAFGQDAFIMKIAYSLGPTRTLVYSSYYGGNDNEVVGGLALTYASFPQPYLVGNTYSTNLPGMNGYDISKDGLSDIFVAGFSIAGNGQVYPSAGTYLGGASKDYGMAILFRNSSEVYVAGQVQAPVPTSPGAFDSTYSNVDAVIAGYSTDLTTRYFCTYLGGSGIDGSGDISMTKDRLGNLYICSSTSSSDFPLRNPYDSTLAASDIFVARFNGDVTNMSFGTLLGGSFSEFGTGIALDTNGCVYVCGNTNSANYPLVGPYDGSLGGITDVSLTKMCVPVSCCVGTVGNVDCSAGDGVDIGDLTTLIDNLFINFTPLCCDAEANCDGLGGVDIGDLTALIDNLFITFTPLPACQ